MLPKIGYSGDNERGRSVGRLLSSTKPYLALFKLKGGDAEYPLQPQPRDRAGIHTRSLEHWHKAEILRQGDRVAVDTGNVEEDLATPHFGQQTG